MYSKSALFYLQDMVRQPEMQGHKKITGKFGGLRYYPYLCSINYGTTKSGGVPESP